MADNHDNFVPRLTDLLRNAARQADEPPQTTRNRYFRHRLFARLSEEYPDKWVLAGATALEVRIDSPRSTSDLDTITSIAIDEVAEAIETLGESPQDPFDYSVKVPRNIHAAEGLTAKITVSYNGKPVERFSVDIEHAVDNGTPPERMTISPTVATGTIADTGTNGLVQASADHIAAKVAGVSKLTTRTNAEGVSEQVNTHRYHDLADLAILSDTQSVSMADLTRSLAFQADKHGVDAIPQQLDLPGGDWNPDKWEQARSLRPWPADLTIERALEKAKSLVDPALEHYHADREKPVGQWTPEERQWTMQESAHPDITAETRKTDSSPNNPTRDPRTARDHHDVDLIDAAVEAAQRESADPSASHEPPPSTGASNEQMRAKWKAASPSSSQHSPPSHPPNTGEMTSSYRAPGPRSQRPGPEL